MKNPVLSTETLAKVAELRRADSVKGETASIDSVLPTEEYFLVTLYHVTRDSYTNYLQIEILRTKFYRSLLINCSRDIIFC